MKKLMLALTIKRAALTLLAASCLAVQGHRPTVYAASHKPELCNELLSAQSAQSTYQELSIKFKALSLTKRKSDLNRLAWAEQRLASLNPDFRVLTIDLGIMSHFESFITFVKEHKLELNNPWAAAQRFRQQSPKVIVYRALSLDESQARLILKLGMESNFLLQPDSSTRTLRMAEIAESGLLSVLHNRFDYDRKKHLDLFLSVSSHPDIAAGVVHYFDSHRNPYVFIFEIEVPEVDLIELTALTSSLLTYPDELKGRIRSGLQTHFVSPNGKANTYNFGAEVESFLFYSISPENIRAVYQASLDQLPTYSSTKGKNVMQTQSDAHYLSTLRKVNSAQDKY